MAPEFTLRRRSVLTLVALAGLLWLHPECAIQSLAAGSAFAVDASSMKPLRIGDQRAFITYQKPIQRLVVGIRLPAVAADEYSSRDLLWIFPVLGTQDQVNTRVIGFFPSLNCMDDVVQSTREPLRQALESMFYPHFPLLQTLSDGFRDPLGPWLEPPIARQFYGKPLGFRDRQPSASLCREQVDSWGVRANSDGFHSVDSLVQYLQSEGIGARREHLDAFIPYLSNRYVLIFVWMPSYNTIKSQFPKYQSGFQGAQPAVLVEFPTKQPYYPLRNIDGFGKVKATVELYCTGWMKPDVSFLEHAMDYSGRTNHASAEPADYDRLYIQYFEADGNRIGSCGCKDVMGANHGMPTDSEAVQRGQAFVSSFFPGRLQYTRVLIRTQSQNFSGELFFSPRPPLRIALASAFASSTAPYVALCLLLVCGLSWVSGGIAGRMVFKEFSAYAWKGLWNILTFFGLTGAMIIIGRKYRLGVVKVSVFIIMFYIVFTVLGVLLCGAAAWMNLVP